MSPRQRMEALRKRGVTLRLVNGQVEMEAPEAVFEQAAEYVRTHKADIIAALTPVRRPLWVCAHCGAALVIEADSPDFVETELADGVTADDGGRVVCGRCGKAQPDDMPDGREAGTGSRPSDEALPSVADRRGPSPTNADARQAGLFG